MMATIISGGTPYCVSACRNVSALSFQNCTPASILASVRNTLRYLYQGMASAGLAILQDVVFNHGIIKPLPQLCVLELVLVGHSLDKTADGLGIGEFAGTSSQ